MVKLLKLLLRDDCGSTAIEYALIGTLISVLLIGGAASIGQNTEASMNEIAENF